MSYAPCSKCGRIASRRNADGVCSSCRWQLKLERDAGPKVATAEVIQLRPQAKPLQMTARACAYCSLVTRDWVLDEDNDPCCSNFCERRKR